MLLASDKREFQAVTGPLSELATCVPKDADPGHGTSDYEESLRLMATVVSDPGHN
jgi:hypothetical protein